MGRNTVNPARQVFTVSTHPRSAFKTRSSHRNSPTAEHCAVVTVMSVSMPLVSHKMILPGWRLPPPLIKCENWHYLFRPFQSPAREWPDVYLAVKILSLPLKGSITWPTITSIPIRIPALVTFTTWIMRNEQHCRRPLPT